MEQSNASFRYGRSSCSRPSCLRLVLIGLLITSIASAQPPKTTIDFQPGDRVEVKFAGKWQAAEVLKVRPPALVEVRLLESRGPQKLNVPARNVRTMQTEQTTAPSQTGTSSTDEEMPTRTWTDSSGHFQVEAALVKAEDGQVTLQRTDGKSVTLPIGSLSQADQDYLAELSANKPETPEDVLRAFLVAMAQGDRPTGRKLIFPNPAAAILWTGQRPPADALAGMEKFFASLPLQRLKVGQTVELPDGQKLEIDTGQVNARRQLLMAADNPIPFILVKTRGGWRVDAAPIIAARQAAGRAAGAEDQDHGEMAGWHPVVLEQGRFRVLMPGKPKRVEQTANSSQGPVQFLVHKASGGGVFWNFYLITYPQAIMDANPDEKEFVGRLATANLRQKTGSQQDSLIQLDAGDALAIEQRFHYPSGRNSQGQYAAGSAIHRWYKYGNQICWLFVDISDSAREARNETIKQETLKFFNSFAVRGGD